MSPEPLMSRQPTERAAAARDTDAPPRKSAIPPGAPADAGVSPDLARVLEVVVEIRVELGRRRMRIGDVLDLGPGAVVEFSKAADEPLDIFVNDQLIARGEAVVVGERYGFRVTEVLSPHERLHRSGVVKSEAL